jgi:hypothetical protein
MFGGESKKMSKISLFEPFGIVGKSVAITTNETRTEDMKLFAVDFAELIEKEIEDEDTAELREKKFEDSALYNYLVDNKLLCVVFQEDSADKGGNIDMRENKFLGFKMIDLGIPELLGSAKGTWDTLRDLIINKKLKDVPVCLKNGEIRITPKTKIQMTAPNFPKSEDNLIFLRGSGKDATNKTQEVNGVKMLKQYYWIKGSYIVDRLKEIEYL